MNNNSKEVTISLTTVQIQDGEKFKTELITKGTFSRSGSDHIISYEDTEATGFKGSTTTIKTCGKLVYISRQGTSNTAISFEPGKKHFSHYETPFGSMQIGVYAKNIINTIEKNGQLYLNYSLDMNGSPISENEILIKIN